MTVFLVTSQGMNPGISQSNFKHGFHDRDSTSTKCVMQTQYFDKNHCLMALLWVSDNVNAILKGKRQPHVHTKNQIVSRLQNFSRWWYNGCLDIPTWSAAQADALHRTFCIFSWFVTSQRSSSLDISSWVYLNCAAMSNHFCLPYKLPTHTEEGTEPNGIFVRKVHTWPVGVNWATNTSTEVQNPLVQTNITSFGKGLSTPEGFNSWKFHQGCEGERTTM